MTDPEAGLNSPETQDPGIPESQESPRATRVIAIANHKGGVGKTTTTLNVGAALVELGRSVLLVDLDPQECLGTALKLPSPASELSLAAVLSGRPEILPRILVSAHGMSVAPAGADLAEAEGKLFGDPTGALTLRDALQTVVRKFEYVLIDCPPSLGALTFNALVAAREVLIPMQTEFLALRRLGAILRVIQRVRRLNPDLGVLGIVPTLYDRRTLHAREVLAQISAAAGQTIFEPIPRSVRFAEAPVAGRPILSYAGDVEGARAYRALAVRIDA